MQPENNNNIAEQKTPYYLGPQGFPFVIEFGKAEATLGKIVGYGLIAIGLIAFIRPSGITFTHIIFGLTLLAAGGFVLYQNHYETILRLTFTPENITVLSKSGETNYPASAINWIVVTKKTVFTSHSISQHTILEFYLGERKVEVFETSTKYPLITVEKFLKENYRKKKIEMK